MSEASGGAVIPRPLTGMRLGGQLHFLRVIPGFAPTAASCALAVEVYARGVEILARAGLTEPGQFDLWTAVLSGLATQQVSNDPCGDRWVRLVDPAVDLLLG